MSEHGERELLLVGVGMMGRPYVAAARRLGLRVRAIEAQDWAGTIEDLVDAVGQVGPRRAPRHLPTLGRSTRGLVTPRG